MTSKIGHVRASATIVATTQNVTISSFGAWAGLKCTVTAGLVDGTEALEEQLSIGLWSSDGSHLGVGWNSENARANRSDCWTIRSSLYGIVIVDNAGAIVRKATFAATTDGITISWFNSAGTATAPAVAYGLEFWVLGGTDAQAKALVVAGPGAAGAHQTVVTSLAFPPEALIGIGYGAFSSSTTPTAASEAVAWIGFASKTGSIKQSCAVKTETDNAPTTELKSVADGNFFLRLLTNGDAFDITAFSSNGFTYNNASQNTTGPDIGVLAVKLGTGVSFWAGLITTPTSVSSKNHTGAANGGGPGFRPQGGIIAQVLSPTAGTIETGDLAGGFGCGYVGNGASATDSSAGGRAKDGVVLGSPTPVTDTACWKSSNLVEMRTSSGSAQLAGTWTAWLDLGITINWTSIPLGSARSLPAMFVSVEPLVLTPNAGIFDTNPPSTTLRRTMTPGASAAHGAGASPQLALRLAPTAAAIVALAAAPTLRATFPQGATAIASSAPAPQLVLVLQPGPSSLSALAAAPTLRATFPQGATAIASSAQTPQLSLLLGPTPSVIVAVAPAPALMFGFLVQPAAAVLSSSAPPPQLVLVLQPSPAVLAALAAAPTLAVVLQPGPAAIAALAGAPTLRATFPQGATAIASSAPASQLSLLLAPTPAVIVAVAPAPTLAFGFLVSPAAAALTSSAPPPQLVLVLQPSPAVPAALAAAPTLRATLSPAAASVALLAAAASLTLRLSPAAAAIVGQAAPAQLRLVIHPNASAIAAVPGAPTLTFGFALQPAAAVLTSSAPPPQLLLELHPSPSVAPLVAPPSQLFLGILVSPAAAVLSSAAPPPQLLVVLSQGVASILALAPQRVVERRIVSLGRAEVARDWSRRSRASGFLRLGESEIARDWVEDSEA